LLLALLAALPARAVLVSFEATDDAGQPLPGATVQIGDQEQVTGADGRVEMDVDAEPGDEVVVVVSLGDEPVYDGRAVVRTDRPVELRTRVRGSSGTPGPLAPIFDDGFESGDTSAWTRPLVGGTFLADTVEPRLEAQRFAVTTTVGGSTVPGQTMSGRLTPAEVDRVNADEDKEHRIPVSYGLRIELPLRRFPTGRREWTGGVPPAGVAGSGGAPPGRGRRFYPTASLTVGQADVEFRSHNLKDDTRATFEGDGLQLGAGLQGVVFPCASCRVFARVGYDYARTEDIEMSRSPGLEGSLPAGISVARDRVEYHADAHVAQIAVGRAFRRFAPWVGVRAVRFRSGLDLDILLRADGQPAEQSQVARNEYVEDVVAAIAGADVRFPGRGVVFRFQGSSDGHNQSVSAGLGVTLGRR
jgi:hypothetical protein